MSISVINIARVLALRLVAVALAILLLVIGGGGAHATQSITPKSLKERALDTLQPYVAESARLRSAADLILESLDPSLWVNDSYVDPEEGEEVFDLERKAVKQLQRAMETSDDGEDLSPEASAAAQAATGDLVAADRLLAVIRFQEAQGTNANDSKGQSQVDRQLDKAGKELDKGDKSSEAGKPLKAIKRYAKAWKHAGRASRHKLAAKAGLDLANLLEEYEDHVADKETDQGFVPSNPFVPAVEGRVVIDVVAEKDPVNLKAKLEALGLQNASTFGRVVSGQLPFGAIERMAGQDLLRFARPAYAATHHPGDLVTSQGDPAMRSDVARTTYSVDGSGVTVGVLSDSFDCGLVAGYGADLPPVADVEVLDDSACPASDEGRGMMQLIHDVAPGASQAFHTAFNGQADFATGITELAAFGADVIVDDVFYFAEPMFQDGIIAQAVDAVVAGGVPYFSSAGNQGRDAYEGVFTPGVFHPATDGNNNETFPRLTGFAPIFAGGRAHDFGGGDEFQQLTIPSGATLRIALQWDDPFFSVSGLPGADSDVDIYLFNDPPTGIIHGSTNGNSGGDPFEFFGVTNGGPSPLAVNIMLVRFSGPDPGLMKYVKFDSGGSVTTNQFDTASGTVYGHSNAAGAEAVGAAYYVNTPEFGTTPPVLESFSSGGTTSILFNISGTPVPPVVRSKPEIVAPDGTNTTFFGAADNPGTGCCEKDGFPNFFGTSAAAPHAAAVAALMLESEPSLTPAAVYSALESTALDMGVVAGFDIDTGFGLIQADLAMDAVTIPEGVSATTTTTTAIDVLFTEDLDGGTVLDTDFAVSGNTVASASETAPGVVTLTVGTAMPTYATPTVTYTQGVLADLSGNLTPSFATLSADGVGPELLSITWRDAGAVPAAFDPGDTLAFEFSESMATNTVNSANVNAVLPVSPAGSYGTSPTVTWSADGITLDVTLDTGTTNISLGSTVNPVATVTDAPGNADSTPGSGPTVMVELVPLSLAAAPLSVVRGQEVLVAVNIGNVIGLKTATYDVSFDTPVLSLESVTAGTVGGTAIPVVSAPVTSSSGSSTATITQDVAAGATGAGTLATLRFTFIGNSGEASGITLGNVELRNLSAVLIPVSISNTAVSSPLVVGDASGDGTLNVLDVTAVELIVAQIRPPTPGADANSSGGVINAVDITGVELLVLGLPVPASGAGASQAEEPPEVLVKDVLVTLEAPVEVQQDQVFTTRLSIAGIEKFDSANFDLTYDPDVLTIDNINPGTGISNGVLDGRSIPIVETNQSEPGVVRVVVNVSGFPGVSGAGYLAEVQFRAVGFVGDTTTIDLRDLVLSDNTAREISSASQIATVTLTGNQPPVAHAGFDLIEVEKSTATFRIQASADDPDGNLETVEAVIETPSLNGLKIRLREDDRFQVKFDLKKNKLEIKGPDPQNVLDQLKSLSGLLVTDGQIIKIKLNSGSNKVEFKIGKDGTLEVAADPVTLRVTAVDALGESDTVNANPVFPAKREPKKGSDEGSEDDDDDDDSDDG